MEKYGVVTDGDKMEKTADSKPRCPRCGAELVESNPPICPNCGSLPLEPEKEEQEQ